jgi:hypothetical protein
MTDDQTDASTSTEDTTSTASAPPEATDRATEPGDQGANREAAKYRRQLRAAESERDALAQRVEAMQRQEIERIAGTEHRLTEPAALWATGTQLADLLTEDGLIDPAKVKIAAEGAVTTLGLAQRPNGAYIPTEGRHVVSRPRPDGADWARFLDQSRTA